MPGTPRVARDAQWVALYSLTSADGDAGQERVLSSTRGFLFCFVCLFLLLLFFVVVVSLYV